MKLDLLLKKGGINQVATATLATVNSNPPTSITTMATQNNEASATATLPDASPVFVEDNQNINSDSKRAYQDLERNPEIRYVPAKKCTAKSNLYQCKSAETEGTPSQGIENQHAKNAYRRLSAQDIDAISKWLVLIDETEQVIIADVFASCRENASTLEFIHSEVRKPKPTEFFIEERRHCHQCQNLTPRGLCLAARRAELKTDRNYYPNDDVPRRCTGYIAGG